MVTKRSLPKNGWDEVLKSEVEKPYFKRLTRFLRRRAKEAEVLPSRGRILRALTLTPPDQVRVVIVGQDPYHGPNQANGLAFSVDKSAKRIPPSLRNIFQELGWESGNFPPHGDLSSWARQGVLLLNSALTVERGKPGSHSSRGWEKFTDEILRFLAHQDRPIIFVLWGVAAKQKLESLNLDDHFVLTAPHPSPYSANLGFFGCDHFNEINKILDSLQEPLIDWEL